MYYILLDNNLGSIEEMHEFCLYPRLKGLNTVDDARFRVVYGRVKALRKALDVNAKSTGLTYLALEILEELEELEDYVFCKRLIEKDSSSKLIILGYYDTASFVKASLFQIFLEDFARRKKIFVNILKERIDSVISFLPVEITEINIK